MIDNCSHHNNLTIKRAAWTVSESVGKVGGIEPHLTAKDTRRKHSCFWRVLLINHASTIEIPVNVPGELLIAESIVRSPRESKFHGSRRVISANHWPLGYELR
jgi:hypothetical protein